MSANKVRKRRAGQVGFTLIELIIGMLVFAIAMTFFVSFIVPQTTRSIDPIFQVRATELAQSLVNEISGKYFDENSSRSSNIRCGEAAATACTLPAALGPDNESRGVFNDVDDFNGLNESAEDILSATGEKIVINAVNLYEGFHASVAVFYDGDLDGSPDSAVSSAKLITVTVTTPNDESMVFATYRYNY